MVFLVGVWSQQQVHGILITKLLTEKEERKKEENGGKEIALWLICLLISLGLFVFFLVLC